VKSEPDRAVADISTDSSQMRTALTIAGSDSGGGAGIQADLKTFAAHGVYGASAITAVTAQNTRGVRAAVALDPALVTAQIDAVLDDLGADAVKIGMLATAPIVAAVAGALARHDARPLVLDTVMLAKSGDRLLDEDAVSRLVADLIPRATIVTPNLPEAERLTGLRLSSPADLRRAAERLLAIGARAVVVMGGHLAGAAVDLFHDGTVAIELAAPRLETRHTHGTGCTFSAAIAARLALGDPLLDAVRAAKQYVTDAIRRAPGLGGGHGPLGH
jgi:hydroxymethylpyrimidine/phosphomethylpyrimidine kinase